MLNWFAFLSKCLRNMLCLFLFGIWLKGFSVCLEIVYFFAVWTEWDGLVENCVGKYLLIIKFACIDDWLNKSIIGTSLTKKYLVNFTQSSPLWYGAIVVIN